MDGPELVPNTALKIRAGQLERLRFLHPAHATHHHKDSLSQRSSQAATRRCVLYDTGVIAFCQHTQKRDANLWLSARFTNWHAGCT